MKKSPRKILVVMLYCYNIVVLGNIDKSVQNPHNSAAKSSTLRQTAKDSHRGMAFDQTKEGYCNNHSVGANACPIFAD